MMLTEIERVQLNRLLGLRLGESVPDAKTVSAITDLGDYQFLCDLAEFCGNSPLIEFLKQRIELTGIADVLASADSPEYALGCRVARTLSEVKFIDDGLVDK